ncbi:MAG: FHA domain-containing protein [Frankiaceae bacterium]
MPELVVFGIRIGLLVLLWVFVLLAVRAARTDLFGSTVRAATAPRPATVTAPRGQDRRDRADRRADRRSSPRKMVVTGGALTGTTVTLGDAPVTIGRAADSTLVLTDDYASARHARLARGDSGWYVEDLGSTNGTYLDRAKVTEPTPVPPGVPIRIGKTTLELRR